MNRRSFLQRATATAGAICAGFALVLQAPEPVPTNRMSDQAAQFFADWPGDRGDEWVPTQHWVRVDFMKSAYPAPPVTPR